ncbi:OmpA family protein [Erythrobacter donghaensis]|uniref:OmpA family protein n=1 Tax=Erythrobacter donghaensis TaxID=267135 RepID=UPI00130239D6|nr:OmpA family protein [Erythrobacter donghaensis]
MKVRFSILAAAAGLCVATSVPASADAAQDADNVKKWRCVIDNICEDGERVVGESIVGEPVRRFDTSATAPAAPKTKSSVKSTAPAPAPKARLREERRQLSTGRGMTGGAAVDAPESVAGRANLFVTFRRGSADIETGNMSDIRALANVMRDAAAAGNKRVIQIGGHTDATGDDATNLKLSDERAQAVRKVLVDLGVPEDAIQAVGYGETKLIEGYDPNHGVNRRVEVVVVN